MNKLLLISALLFPSSFGFSRIQVSSLATEQLSVQIKKTPKLKNSNVVGLIKASPSIDDQIDLHANIQIQADKDHGVFVSVSETMENDLKARHEFAFSSGSAYRILDDKLQNSDEDIERWSKELARYRHSKNDVEKLFLIKELLDDAVERGDYVKVDDLINCQSHKLKSFSKGVLVSFHPTVYVEDGILLGGDDSVVLNIRMQNEIIKLQERMGRADLRGVLYAWNPDQARLQYCDVFIPH